ncbi:MAG: NAD(P)-dependent oxidoreductase [Deltaproteobacteria bacterium]|nr:NAD(P)-dependent oxidoreductase [Deltaproteobacteria bacterium]
MRFLVTGATGFVGRHIVKKLQNKKHEIAILVRDFESALIFQNFDTHFVNCELILDESSKASIKKFDPEVCIHLAWEGIPNFSEEISKKNLDNTISFLGFIVRKTNCKKIIISGSCLEYGVKKGKCKENEQIRISSFFGWAKNSIYNYISIISDEFGVDLIWFRLFYVYGPGQRMEAIIPTIADKLLKAENPRILNPFNKNDFVNIMDVVDAFEIASINEVSQGIYNIGSGYATSIYKVFNTIEKLITGQTSMSETLISENGGESEIDFFADINKTKKKLGWKPKISLEDGIKKYIHSIEKGKI